MKKGSKKVRKPRGPNKKKAVAESGSENQLMEVITNMSEKVNAALEEIAETMAALAKSLAKIAGSDNGEDGGDEPAKGKKAEKEDAGEEKGKKEDKGEKEVELTEEELNAMDKDELVELAKKVDIKHPEKMKEKELRVEIIEAATAEEGEKPKGKEDKKEAKTEFEKGDEVLALYPGTDDEFYKATYVKSLKGGKLHQVTWDDGDDNDTPVTEVKERE